MSAFNSWHWIDPRGFDKVLSRLRSTGTVPLVWTEVVQYGQPPFDELSGYGKVLAPLAQPGSAASPRRLASSLTVAAMRRHLGEGAELPEPLGGTVLALCVRDHRPDVGQDAETWVEGIDVEASSSAPADVAARAGRYATAVGLAEDPMTTVRSLTVLRLALCWMHDDALSPAEREIFAVLLADGMPTQKAINAARLLA